LNNIINVLYEDNHIIVVEKPINMPVQPDASRDVSVLDKVKEYVKIKYKKPGNVFIGLVHRLDRPVGGVMVFARTSKGASRLSAAIRDKKLIKEYLAVIRNCPEAQEGTMVNYLIKDTRTNKTKVVNEKNEAAKKAILKYKVLSRDKTGISLVKIDLITGRPHQIRVQFATRGLPLVGDVKYGREVEKRSINIALWSYNLIFPNPITSEEMTFTLPPPKNYPWNLF